MFVIFEGLDKAGKTTLEWEFLKATNFKHIVIDRGPAGYVTFDTLFERRTKEGDKQYIVDSRVIEITGDFAVVYCKVPVSVAMQRLKDHNETCPYDYEKAQTLYDLAVNTLYKDIDVILVDTTKSIEECVKLIVEKIEGGTTE